MERIFTIRTPKLFVMQISILYIIMVWGSVLRGQSFQAWAFTTPSSSILSRQCLSRQWISTRDKRYWLSFYVSPDNIFQFPALVHANCRALSFTATGYQRRRIAYARTSLRMSSTNNHSSNCEVGAAALNTDGDGDFSPPWQKELNPTQVEAVTKPIYSITRVIAGPGSGKTRVLTSRITFLLKEDPRSRILAVTFTRKAAGEMKHRLETLLKEASMTGSKTIQDRYNNIPDRTNGNAIMEEECTSDSDSLSSYVRDLSRVTLGTFHKICADILRYNGDYLSSLPSINKDMLGRNATVLDGRFVIMDQSEQLRIMKECLAAAQIDLKVYNLKPLVVLNVLTELKAAINKGEDPFQAQEKEQKIPKQIEVARTIYGLYRETMLSNNLLDFDDLIYLTRELLMENQEIRQQLHRRWTHILVDEYQDTSRAQIDLVRLWTASSLLVVGDGDQSIYSWRGAEPNSLSSFDDEFKNYLGEIHTVHLTENYRSTSNIVNAAQKVIASGETSLAKKLRQNMKPKRGSGSTPQIVACADEKTEANFVVKTILNELESGRYAPDTSVAVLYRTNVQSRVLEEACVQHNLPYVILGKATSFYKRREVKDCLCYLRWVYNGRDKGSMLRAFQTPSRGLGDKAIQQFEEYCDMVDRRASHSNEQLTPLDILLSFTSPERPGMPLRNETIATRPLKLFTQFASQMEKLSDLAFSCSVEKVLTAVIADFDLMAHFEKTSDSKAEFEERQSNVQELRQATTRYNQDGPCLAKPSDATTATVGGPVDEIKSPLGAFLDDVALVTDIGNNEKVDNSQDDPSQKRFVVSLMTIHASKGMEFDSVFVTGNEDENFPTMQAIQAGKGSVKLAEECRLCYVAMTRAKTDLFLTWRRESTVFSPKSASGFRVVNRNRSRFLDALVGKGKGEKSAPGLSKTDSRGSKGPSPVRKQVRSMSTSSRRSSSLDLKPRENNGWKTNNNVQNYNPSMTRSTGRQSYKPNEFNRNGSPSPPKRAGTALSPTDKALKRQHNGVPTHVAEAPPQDLPASQGLNSSQKRPPRQKAPMDSTWFYPVGSAVVHKKYGRGLVLNPPPTTNADDLLVRVKFQDGEKRDLSARGDELKPEI